MSNYKNEANKESLYEKLKIYGKSDAYPFHMPGHKRNTKLMKELMDRDQLFLPYEICITQKEFCSKLRKEPPHYMVPDRVFI